MREWSVLIVEDDLDVARLHQSLIARRSGFRVSGWASSGEAALRQVVATTPDLLLLDLKLNGLDGLALARRLRAHSAGVEIIVATSDQRAEVVEAVIHLGVVDYLLKPFGLDLLDQALGRFVHRRRALEAELLDQQVIEVACGGGRRGSRWLPRGLARETFEAVRHALGNNPDGVSAEELAAQVGLARVTVRRYLEHLEANGQAEIRVGTRSRGRPRKFYVPSTIRPLREPTGPRRPSPRA
ncbi:MAG: response regulator [Actinobacteria bacterium]|nr:response regulator [Actinomycetota bacterium]